MTVTLLADVHPVTGTVDDAPALYLDSAFRRVLCVVPAWFSAVVVYNVFVDVASFASPVFAEIRDIAPLEWWGAAWGAAGVLALSAGVSARWSVYLAAHALLAGLAGLWIAQLVYVRWFLVPPIKVSTLAIFGLWGILLLLPMVVMIVPTHLTSQRPRRNRAAHHFDID